MARGGGKPSPHHISPDIALGSADIQRSLRFNRGDAPYLQATLGNGDENRWTWSGWVKKTVNGQHQNLFSSGSDVVYTHINFDNSDRIRFQNWHSAQKGTKITTRRIRDNSAWMHIVVIWDSGNATADDRMRIYVNGTRETTFDDSTNPDQNQDSVINGNSLGGSDYGEGKHFIGKFADTSDNSGTYKAEINFIDGTALTPSSFGFTDPQTGIWMPKRFEKSSIPNKKGRTFSGTWTASGNGFGGSNPITNAFDGDLSTSANNDGGGQILTWNTSTYNLRGELRIYCRSSSGVYDIYVNGNSGNTTKVGDTPSSNGWVECGTFDHIKEIQFAGTTYNTGTGLGSAGVHILAIMVDGTLLRNNMPEYGTNGFYLDFSDNTSTTTLGIDKSPNGNDFTANNFSVAAWPDNDSVIDTPTNNFATLSPIDSQGNAPSDGNLRGGTAGTSGWRHTRSTAFPTTGKWYWEVKLVDGTPDGSNGYMTGIAYPSLSLTQDVNSDSRGMYGRQNQEKYLNDNSNPVDSDFTTTADGDVLQYAWDVDNGKLYTGKNNSWEESADPSTGTNANWTGVASGASPFVGSYGSSIYTIINFGQQAFTYTPPTGFNKLSSSDSIPTPPSVVRPQKHFDIVLYTGNGASSARAITGLEFAPDFIWLKNRETTYHHQLHDTVRGVSGGVLYSNQNSGEDSTYSLASFDSNGFSISKDANQDGQNNNGDDYVAWCWKGGGAAVSNDDGSITSSVSVNQEAGFSIVTHTGTGADATVGHGLGKIPACIIIKNRDRSVEWIVKHQKLTSGKILYLDLNSGEDAATGTNNGIIGDLNNASTFSLSRTSNTGNYNNVNVSGEKYVSYCWTEISGYSKFGSYIGNGNADGTFVHLGFRPAWLMIKNTATSGWWFIYDVKRETYNPMYNIFGSNVNNAEYYDNAYKIDIVSNGFKARGTQPEINKSGDTIIYMAFADQPGTTPFDTFPNAR